MHKINYFKRIALITLLIIPAVCLYRIVRFRLELIGPLDIFIVRQNDYNKQNMHAEMLLAYKKLCDKYPERTDLLYPLGWAYHKTGNSKKGYALMERYTEANPFHPEWQNYYIEAVKKKAKEDAI